MRATRIGAVWLVAGTALLTGACSNPGGGSGSATGSNKPAQPEPSIETKVTTPARPPASPAASTGLANAVPIEQRVRVGEWEVVVTGPWKDGDGQVIDPVKGPDSYGPDKKFVLVPVEVSRTVGDQQKKLVDGYNLIMTYMSADPANPVPDDFATNCPYDETWPNKVDLWKATAASGETLQGNACFIVPKNRIDAFVLGVAPFGQKTGTETYFATH